MRSVVHHQVKFVLFIGNNYNMPSTIYDYLLDILPVTGIVIECGGHLGTDTTALCKLVPDGVVHCVEASPSMFRHIEQTLVPAHLNLQLHNCALADKNSRIKFFVDKNVSGDGGASSALQSTEAFLANYIKNEDEIEVDGVTLDAFWTSIYTPEIDLLWLDIEGFEYKVLVAATESLRHIKYIYTEVNFQQFRRDGCVFDDINTLLTKNGFVLIDKWAQGANWGEWQGNVLYRNASLT